MKKIILTISIFFLFITNVNALNLSSKNIILYNLNEDKVIYEENKDKKTSIASLTKIMTVLVALDNIEDYNKKITINYTMFNGLREQNAYVIGLRHGQVVTYNDLLYGTFLASGADATRALAISIAGSEEKYVELMNKKAKELGMNNTNFKNTTGLDENNQYSTVNDVAILLKSALKNTKFKEIFTKEKYLFSDKSMTVYSSLKKTAKNYGYDVNYIIGGKTGYTYNAGKSLASLAIDEKNNIEYLLITTNASTNTSDAYHIKDATTIYKYYFDNYKYHTLVNKDELLVTLDTKYSKEENIKIYADKEINYYLENTFKKEDVKLKYTGINVITPNHKKNTKLGTVDVIYNDKVLNTIDIYLEKETQFSIIEFLKVNIKYVIIIIVIILILILIIIKKFVNLRKQK